MASKLPLSDDGFACVQALQPGEALMFASWAEFGSQEIDAEEPDGEQSQSSASSGSTDGGSDDRCFVLRVRPRITEDRGASRHNVRG